MASFHRRERQANVVGGRPGRFVVKTSVAETAALRALADARGVSVARLLVSSALSERAADAPTRAELTEMLGYRTYVGALSNNVNQLAKVANATNELPQETEATLAAVRSLVPRLQAALDRFITP